LHYDSAWIPRPRRINAIPVHVYLFNAKDTNVPRATHVRVGRLHVQGAESPEFTDPALEYLDAHGNVVAAFILNQIVGYRIDTASTTARRTVRQQT
jgi:pimeloyl-CoA synthetase